MPRPNPPRKRPRRRPDARADAALNKQTAQSTQPKNQNAPAKSQNAALKSAQAGAAAGVAPDEMWSRRSYAILVAFIALLQIPINIIYFLLQPSPKAGTLVDYLLILQPLPLLAACLVAAPVARYVTQERRSLRFMESVFVGIVTYFIWLVLAVAAGALLNAVTPAPVTRGGTGCATSSGPATPLPNGTSSSGGASASPCPSPAATASPSSSTSGSASPSASPSASVTTATSAATPVVYASFTVLDIVAFVLTVYAYPPLYKRMRVRRPPPGPRKPRSSKADETK